MRHDFRQKQAAVLTVSDLFNSRKESTLIDFAAGNGPAPPCTNRLRRIHRQLRQGNEEIEG